MREVVNWEVTTLSRSRKNENNKLDLSQSNWNSRTEVILTRIEDSEPIDVMGDKMGRSTIKADFIPISTSAGDETQT